MARRRTKAIAARIVDEFKSTWNVKYSWERRKNWNGEDVLKRKLSCGERTKGKTRCEERSRVCVVVE